MSVSPALALGEREGLSSFLESSYKGPEFQQAGKEWDSFLDLQAGWPWLPRCWPKSLVLRPGDVGYGKVPFTNSSPQKVSGKVGRAGDELPGWPAQRQGPWGRPGGSPSSFRLHTSGPDHCHTV